MNTQLDEFSLTHSNGIFMPHLSASTISSFIENKQNWWNSKVMRNPFKGNVHTSIGQAVESGVNFWLENPGVQVDCLAHANQKYDEAIEGTGSPRDKVMEYRNMIPAALEVMLRHYKRKFAETGALTQHKIELTLDGVNRPIIGYLDFLQQGVAVRDSKVVGRSPSGIKQSYAMQGALYKHATGLDMHFDFCILNKTPVVKEIELSDDDYEFGLSYLTRGAQVLEELEECENPKRVMQLMCFPSLDSFYSIGEKLQAAKDWGIKIPLGYYNK